MRRHSRHLSITYASECLVHQTDTNGSYRLFGLITLNRNFTVSVGNEEATAPAVPQVDRTDEGFGTSFPSSAEGNRAERLLRPICLEKRTSGAKQDAEEVANPAEKQASGVLEHV